MSELHLLIATGERLTPERIEELLGLPEVRAFGETLLGTSRTLSYVSGSPAGVGTAGETTCPESIKDCLDYIVEAVGGVFPCSIPPREANVHVLVTVTPGSRRAFAEVLVEVQQRLQADGQVQLAAGHLFGPGPHHFVVEVVAGSTSELSDVLLDVLDRDVVLHADTHLVLPHQAHRWGELAR